MTAAQAMIGMKADTPFRESPRLCGVSQVTESAKRFHTPVMFNLGKPFASFSLKKNAVVAGLVVCPDSAISHVVGPRTASQILQSVVRAIAIKVVNIVRIVAGHHFPNNSMSKIRNVLNRPMTVAICGKRCERGLSGILAIPSICAAFGRVRSSDEHARRPRSPYQIPCGRIVFKKRAQAGGIREWTGLHNTPFTSNPRIFQVLKLAKAMA